MRHAKLILALALIIAVGAVSYAASDNRTSGDRSVVYDVDAQTFASPNQRTALAGADTLTTTGILATPEFKIRGRQTIFVNARFSNASQTCQVQIAYVYKSGDPDGSATNQTNNKVKGYSSVFTLTGSASQKEGTYYEAPDALFDTEGAVTVRVLLIAAPSAGTVTLVTGS